VRVCVFLHAYVERSLCCSVLQCDVEWCSVLQCIAVCDCVLYLGIFGAMVFCSVLQCIAMYVLILRASLALSSISSLTYMYFYMCSSVYGLCVYMYMCLCVLYVSVCVCVCNVHVCLCTFVHAYERAYMIFRMNNV